MTIDGQLSFDDGETLGATEVDSTSAFLDHYAAPEIDLSRPYGATAENYWRAGWTGVLPLPAGRKLAPPAGWTGHGAPYLSYPDVYALINGPEAAGNICLRTPPGVVALDVDAHGGKTGGKTLWDLCGEHGPLPATWRSSARGNPPGGHYFFRVPEGLEFVGGVPGIEILQAHHRYAVVWPSTNPDADGARYRWYDPSGRQVDAIPKVDELPWLPGSWIEALRSTGTRVNAVTLANREVEGWLKSCRDAHGRPCGQMRSQVELVLRSLRERGSRHDAALAGTRALVAFAGEGHGGILTALSEVRDAFLDLVTTVGAGLVRDATEARKEFYSMTYGAVRIAAAKNPQPERGDPGTCITWDDVPEWAGPVTQKAPARRVSIDTHDSSSLAGAHAPGLQSGDGAKLPSGPAGTARRVVDPAPPRSGNDGATASTGDDDTPDAAASKAVDDTYVSPAPGVRRGLNVSNPSIAAEWLRESVGRGPLSGVFKRGDASSIVHCPAVGEHGYKPPRDARDDDGPAQVRPFTPQELAARVQFTWGCYRERPAKDGDDTAMEVPGDDGSAKKIKRTPAMFPLEAAMRCLAAPDMLPYVRRLAGVVHTPTIREDGTLLRAPGYDMKSRLLHLPDPTLQFISVSDEPNEQDIASARALIFEMLQDFPFVTPHDRAAYIGLLLTPLLRAIAPAPYKLFVISAHQAGSGKTLLAEVARAIHGGVFRSEMPEDDAELRKQITSILTVTTGPIVNFDNVTGVIRSSTLAGLLTSAVWDDRKLGGNELARCVNDRVWMLTGNNMALGGDLHRRSIWVNIDPGRPDPHLRTDFKIPDLREWLRENRGRIIAALLTLIRAWDAAGRPGERVSGDGYGRWLAAVNGVLGAANIAGTCDAAEARGQDEGTDDQDWGHFLAAIERVFGAGKWTAKDLLSKVNTGSASLFEGIVATSRPLAIDDLPAELAERMSRLPAGQGPALLGRSLGKWLANRRGRWAGNLTVREAGKSNTGILWQVYRYETAEES